MSKRKERKRVAALYASVIQRAQAPPEHAVEEGTSSASAELSRLLHAPPTRPLMKKFRFQLLHHWMVEHLAPCRVADVGGGKGLLAYLLQQSGWEATVIDPLSQPLPTKFRALGAEAQTRIPPEARVPRLDRAFEAELARDYDLLVAMHAHGCIISVLDAAARFHREAIVLPCCIIHEPLLPPPGVHWLQCVVDYAVRQGLQVEPFRLNFSGQNIGLYAQPGAQTSAGVIR